MGGDLIQVVKTSGLSFIYLIFTWKSEGSENRSEKKIDLGENKRDKILRNGSRGIKKWK